MQNNTPTKHKDCLNRPISIGDKVYIIENLQNYGTPYAFKVVGATNYYVKLTNSDGSHTFRQSPDRLIILDAQMQDNRTSFPEFYI